MPTGAWFCFRTGGSGLEEQETRVRNRLRRHLRESET